MANTSAPRGLRPVQTIHGHPWNGETKRFAMASGTTQSNALFIGTPVALSSGLIIRGNVNMSDFLGTFEGVRYLDSDGKLVIAQHWPSGGVSGATNVFVDVACDPDLMFEVEVVSSVTPGATNVGSAADMTGTSGSTVTHYSSATLDLGTGDAMRIVALAPKAGNSWAQYAKVWVIATTGHNVLK